MPKKFANAVLFNCSWCAIVLTQSALIAPVILVAHLAAHFSVMGKGRSELLLVAAVTVFGAGVDQLLFALGVFNLAGQPALAPLWLACLWPVFATTLLHSFEGLQHRTFLAMVVGAVGGAASYTAGVRLTAVDFGSPLWGPIILGALWAVVLPLLLHVSARLQSQRDALQSWHPQVPRA